VALDHHELGARVLIPESLRHWGADGWWVGRGRAGVGICACNPSRESNRKAHVLHLEAGIGSVPPRRYTGRSCGSSHRLGHRAHNAANHGYWGLGHSGAMTSMRQPSRAAFATTSSRRLNGGFAHRGPAVAKSHGWANASSSLVQ